MAVADSGSSCVATGQLAAFNRYECLEVLPEARSLTLTLHTPSVSFGAGGQRGLALLSYQNSPRIIISRLVSSLDAIANYSTINSPFMTIQWPGNVQRYG